MLTMQQRLAGLPPALVPQIADLAQSIDRGRLAEADRALVVAAAQAPAHPEVLRLRGMLRLAQGRAAEAIALLSDASGRRPDDASIHYTLALACEAAHDPVSALAAIRRACATGPELADCWYGLGRMLFDAGQLQPGIDALQRAVELAPRHANARAMLATILNLDGHPDAAQAQYREIVAQRPGSGAAWWGLATLKPMPLDAGDIARMSAALQTSGLAETDRIAMLFALAHAQEGQARYVQAMASLRQAHELARRRDPWDARQFDARIDGILGAFSSPPAGAPPGRGEEVIFIVSLPRSGSTLTEQILASHSQVQGTRELADLPQLIKSESARRQQPFPQWTATLSEADWDDLGQRYLSRNLLRLLPLSFQPARLHARFQRSCRRLAWIRPRDPALAGAVSRSRICAGIRSPRCRSGCPHPRVAGLLRPAVRGELPELPRHRTPRGDAERGAGAPADPPRHRARGQVRRPARSIACRAGIAAFPPMTAIGRKP